MHDFCLSRCELLTHILNDDESFKSIWQTALNWLQAEMDRVSLQIMAQLVHKQIINYINMLL